VSDTKDGAVISPGTSGHPLYSPDLVPNSTAKEFLNLRQNGASASV